MGHTRPLIRFFRKIALVRNADDLLHQSKRTGDFSRGRQQRNDPHH
jgi:hypothetical protein